MPTNRISTTAFHVYAISSINRVGKFHWISHGAEPPKFICMRCPGRYASAQKFQNEFPPTRTVFVFISSRKNEKHFSKKNKNIQIEITPFFPKMDLSDIAKKLGLSDSKQLIRKAAEIRRLCDVQFDSSIIGVVSALTSDQFFDLYI